MIFDENENAPDEPTKIQWWEDFKEQTPWAKLTFISFGVLVLEVMLFIAVIVMVIWSDVSGLTLLKILGTDIIFGTLTVVLVRFGMHMDEN